MYQEADSIPRTAHPETGELYANVSKPRNTEQVNSAPLCKYIHNVQELLWIMECQLQRRACIDSRMLSTTVASPCQTLCELLAGDHE